VLNQHQNQRASERADGRSATWENGSRPWRVVPLALFAVAATVGAVAATSHMFRDLSGDRYARDVIQDELRAVRF